ncbi:MAG: hypothetical protein GXY48_00735 [Methanomicrobiales archaeon]|nr:hypothetical protein [Methanomicrobiales archaeon]
MDLFKNSDEKNTIGKIAWSVPFPPDLLARLRGFSAVSIAKASGMYLDDVFDILKGSRKKTSPEVIEMLENVLRKLEEEDQRLEHEAAKIKFMIQGFEALEQKDIKNRLNRLPEKSESSNEY